MTTWTGCIANGEDGAEGEEVTEDDEEEANDEPSATLSLLLPWASNKGEAH